MLSRCQATEDHGGVWEETACSCILPHLPPDREDRSERRLGSDPRIWGSDKPLRSPGWRAARPRGASIARVITSGFTTQSVSPATEGEDKMGGNATGKRQEHSNRDRALSPLARFARRCHVPHPEGCSPPFSPAAGPLLFPPQHTGPARSPRRV